ncbi:GNAT family N-acetyltransferase [Alkalicoccobacillus gibsonii]|jgi:N-acetylglutamate synthase-like GNAT family acetyltransferase|uniref:GNAT family N-acetyltransferase n=1 Tax=Alkalicoccobacillus gibsonii TaxID=79881 RepID=UPI0035179841
MIRLATLDDAQDIAQLTLQLGYNISQETARKRLTHLLSATDHALYVFENKNSLSGWAHIYIKRLIELEYAEIGGIVVQKNNRRSGVGLKLMQACEEWAKANKIDEVRLRSGEQRAEAHTFYLNLGYEHVRNQKVFIKKV